MMARRSTRWRFTITGLPQYSSESSANPPVLPDSELFWGNSLLGASMASRRDYIGRLIAPDDTSISNNRVDILCRSCP